MELVYHIKTNCTNPQIGYNRMIGSDCRTKGKGNIMKNPEIRKFVSVRVSKSNIERFKDPLERAKSSSKMSDKNKNKVSLRFKGKKQSKELIDKRFLTINKNYKKENHSRFGKGIPKKNLDNLMKKIIGSIKIFNLEKEIEMNVTESDFENIYKDLGFRKGTLLTDKIKITLNGISKYCTLYDFNNVFEKEGWKNFSKSRIGKGKIQISLDGIKYKLVTKREFQATYLNKGWKRMKEFNKIKQS